jgi:hypothetical protein
VRSDLRVVLGEAVNTKRLNCVMCSSRREKVAEIGLEDALIFGQILAFQYGAAELDHIAALGEFEGRAGILFDQENRAKGLCRPACAYARRSCQVIPIR